MPPVRPQLKPARRVWRDARTLQFGTDPSRAVVITGLDPGRARLVERLDGTSDVTALRRDARLLGLGSSAVDDLLGVLAQSGVLEDGAADEEAVLALDRAERDRLEPDRAAASLLRPTESGAGVLARRRAAAVTVLGVGRVGGSVAGLLAAAGVGTVTAADAALTRPSDLAPAGLRSAALGTRRQDALRPILREISPQVRSQPPTGRGFDLVIVAQDGGLPDPRVGERLLRAGAAHLYLAVRDTVGVVGPLVVPGRTSCRRCQDLHRTERDPAWPTVAAQLSTAGRAPVDACDVALATAVAALGALQALAFLDGADPLPPSADGTLEVGQGDGLVRRRSWPRHPCCGCGWPLGDPAGDD